MFLKPLNESRRLRYFSFFYLYVMQGIPAGFATTAICNYLAGQGIQSQVIGTFAAIVGIPWIIQIIWGPIIDRYQYSVIGHRKQWLVLTQAVACMASLSLLLVDDPIKEISLLTIVFFIHSVFASIQDASADAIAIDVTPENERGRVNAFMRGGFLIGYAVGSAALSWMMHTHGYHAAVGLQSFILIGLTVVTYIIKLDKKDSLLPSFKKKESDTMIGTKDSESNPLLRLLFTELYKGVTARQNFSLFCIILLVYMLISFFIGGYSYYIIHDLHWSDKEVSILQGAWGSILTLLIIFIGGVLSDYIGASKLMRMVMLGIGCYLIIINSLFSFWHSKALTTSGLILWNFADPLFSVATFPLLMNMCRLKVQGSQFTAYMALINFSGIVGGYAIGWAQTFVKVYWLGLFSGIVIITALIYLQIKNKHSVL